MEKKLISENKSSIGISKELMLEEKVKTLEKELSLTRKRLAKAEMIAEFQKKFTTTEPEAGRRDKRAMIVEMITEKFDESVRMLNKYEMCDVLGFQGQHTTLWL